MAICILDDYLDKTNEIENCIYRKTVTMNDETLFRN